MEGSSLYSQYPDSALTLFTQALQLARMSNYTVGKGKALVRISSIHYNNGHYDQCIACCQEVLAMDPKSIIINDLIYAHNNLGKAYRAKAAYQKASYYSQNAMALAIQHNIKDTFLLIDVYAELGLQEGGLGNKEKALQYLQKAEHLCLLSNDTESLCTIIANMTLLTGKKEHAIQSLRLGRVFGNYKAQLRGASTLSSLYASEGRKDSALVYMKETERIAHTLSYDKSELISAYFTLSAMQYALNDFGTAEKTLEHTLAYAEKWGVFDRRIPAGHGRLASLYARRGAWQKAFGEQKKVMETYSRFLSEKDAAHAKALEARYQAAEKDKALTQKQLQISQQKNKLTQKNILIGSLALSAFLLGIILYTRMRMNRQKQLSQEKEIFILKQQQDLLRQQMEINHLKDQIEGEEKERMRIARELHDGIVSQLIAVKLHFKGALQKVNEKEVFEPTIKYLEEATSELRKTTHNLMPEKLMQNGLFSALMEYCEKMETASGIKIYFEHFGSLRIQDKSIELSLYRIVQELVQNAIKHAQANHILVEINAEDNYITLTVEDDGLGCTEGSIKEAAGMGLKSIRSRVDALEGTLEIGCIPGKGTAVNIEFNLKESWT